MRGKKSSKNTLFHHVNMYLSVENFYSGDDIVAFRLSGAVFKMLLQKFRRVLK